MTLLETLCPHYVTPTRIHGEISTWARRPCNQASPSRFSKRHDLLCLGVIGSLDLFDALNVSWYQMAPIEMVKLMSKPIPKESGKNNREWVGQESKYPQKTLSDGGHRLAPTLVTRALVGLVGQTAVEHCYLDGWWWIIMYNHTEWGYSWYINKRWLVDDKRGAMNCKPTLSILAIEVVHDMDLPVNQQRVLNTDQFSKPYRLVNKHSYWKWPFIVDFPIKKCDFP